MNSRAIDAIGLTTTPSTKSIECESPTQCSSITALSSFRSVPEFSSSDATTYSTAQCGLGPVLSVPMLCTVLSYGTPCAATIGLRYDKATYYDRRSRGLNRVDRRFQLSVNLIFILSTHLALISSRNTIRETSLLSHP